MGPHSSPRSSLGKGQRHVERRAVTSST